MSLDLNRTNTLNAVSLLVKPFLLKGNFISFINDCYEMDKTSFSMFEILEPGGQLWANTAFEGSQFYSIGVPKFYSWVNVISVYVYHDLG